MGGNPFKEIGNAISGVFKGVTNIVGGVLGLKKNKKVNFIQSAQFPGPLRLPPPPSPSHLAPPYSEAVNMRRETVVTIDCKLF